MKKFAIIGGSFNPVTKAHVEIGQIASKELPGWQILYIPAPDRFLTSWKSMEKKEILSGKKRLLLLEKAVKPHGFLCEDCEVFGKTSARTYDTMQYLRDRYGQETELVYVCGTDKLSELSTWYNSEGIFTLSKILVIPRDGDEPEKMIEEIPFLSERRDRILVSHEPRVYPDFSATKVRDSLKSGDGKWREFVPDEIVSDLEKISASEQDTSIV